MKKKNFTSVKFIHTLKVELFERCIKIDMQYTCRNSVYIDAHSKRLEFLSIMLFEISSENAKNSFSFDICFTF